MNIKISCCAMAILVLFSQRAFTQTAWPIKEWANSTPEKQQMSADVLRALDKEIANGRYGKVDEMLVTRHGALVYQKQYPQDYEQLYGERAKRESGLNHFPLGGPFNYYDDWWHPYYHHGELHTLQSVTKSVVSAIIGTAIARKEFPDITTPVLRFFDTSKVANIDDRKRRMTIRHLLTMMGGFEWEEWNSVEDPGNDCFVMEASCDWVQYVIDKPMVAEPGIRFKYSSGGSQLLSYIFRKATGKDIEEYAAEFLFKPLGITNFYWKRTPTGLPDTEGGLYLRVTDLAKIGYLYLRGGEWNGSRIVTADWIKTSVTPAASLGPTTKYGYKWWLMPYGADNAKFAWCCRGFGGQTMVIIPEYEVVAVFTGWTIIEGERGLDVNEILRWVGDAVLDR